MGSLKQSYLVRLIRSILIISLLFGSTIYAKPQFYTISTAIHGNGIIAPEGIINVKAGGKKRILIKADTLNSIDSVLVDGINIGILNNYTFENVYENHNLSAYFSKIQPETTVVLSQIHKNSKDTISERDTLITELLDTVCSFIKIEWSYDTTFTTIDSLSDSLLFSTTLDTCYSSQSSIISQIFDTLYYQPDTTVVINITKKTQKDTLSNSVVVITEEYDTVITTTVEEFVNETTFTQKDSLSDSIIFSTALDTLIDIYSIVLSETFDTLFLELNFDTTTLCDTSISFDIDTVINNNVYVNFDYDTISITTIKNLIYKTTIIKVDSLSNNHVFNSYSDTSTTFYENLISEVSDTAKYIEVDDPTDVVLKENNYVKPGFAAGPNPFTIGSEELKIIFSSKKRVNRAKLMVFDKLGNVLKSFDDFELLNRSSILFRWNGYTSDGYKVNAGSVIAIVNVAFADGSIKKEKVIVGIKK